MFDAFTLLGKWLFCLKLSSVLCHETGYCSESSQVKQMSHVVLTIIDSSVHVHMSKPSKHSVMALICDPNLWKLHWHCHIKTKLFKVIRLISILSLQVFESV